MTKYDALFCMFFSHYFLNIGCKIKRETVLKYTELALSNEHKQSMIVLTLSLREAAHSGSGVLAMGREAAVSGSPIYPGQF